MNKENNIEIEKYLNEILNKPRTIEQARVCYETVMRKLANENKGKRVPKKNIKKPLVDEWL